MAAVLFPVEQAVLWSCSLSSCPISDEITTSVLSCDIAQYISHWWWETCEDDVELLRSQGFDSGCKAMFCASGQILCAARLLSSNNAVLWTQESIGCGIVAKRLRWATSLSSISGRSVQLCLGVGTFNPHLGCLVIK